MKKFDYKEYLAEGWLFKEAGAKDAYFNRQKRAQKGNWNGSVGKYVEDHRAEIDAAAKRGHGELRAYMRTKMMPALGPEEQEYLEQLLAGYATDQQLLMALYNILLKGHGLGLHEEENIPADISKRHISTDDKLNLAAGGKTLQQAVKILQKQFNYPIVTGKVFGGTVIDLSQVPPEERDKIIQWTNDNLGGYGYTY